MTINALGVMEARFRIKGKIHETPIMHSQSIDQVAGCQVYCKCEHLQKTGSFKGRGATNAVARLMEKGGVKEVITHSSGNHGQGLAWAAKQYNLPCCVVHTKNTPEAKKEAMAGYGARLEECENNTSARAETCARLAKELDYVIVESSDDFDVACGQGTAAAEMLEQVDGLDAIFVAVGGGGLASGVAAYVKETHPHVRVFLVEPEGKNLASFLNSGEYDNISDTVNTIADGVRVRRVSKKCFSVLQRYCKDDVVTVREDDIRSALRLIWTRTKHRVEPTAAVPLAGLFKTDVKKYAIKKAGVILCGGNVDITFVP